METPEISPRRPYLLRAFYDELINSQLTPYLLVDTTEPNVKLPPGQGCDGRIIFNLSPYAVENLQLGNHEVSFNASFNYVPYHVIVPMKAVLAIYAKENGEGMVFEKEAAYDDVESKTISDNENPVTTSSNLTLVANKDEGQQDDKSLSDDDNQRPPPRGNRPTLRIVK
ncbi:ClpXP protease specificity-enhancing factor SspB [Candidatus Regiella insecticola]|uniref:ClpXP protease specificity-enhancing factor n=1 Tax=Candidatus Regiella insecticola TaxID=138073 RepID=A0A6L2ZQD6_9ENTR|nr:ClpXP protease specificity-enhancing factor SspB [Candidatus Regiella insecticola]GFN46630.1 clpXP protease specificity-enhancing factor [Candidatus Regiella insecticola]